MSTAKFNQWQNPDGSENYKCRAWVNFNGVGTVAIRSAGNVSSITDNGTGDYTVNFATPLPDRNYAVSGMTVSSAPPGVNNGTNAAIYLLGPRSTSQIRVGTCNLNANSTAANIVLSADQSDVSVVAFR